MMYSVHLPQYVQQSVHKSTTCDVETSTTHFPVPFGPIFQILMAKNLKIFPNVVLIAQKKRFGTLNATQKIAALYKAPFLKKSRKTARNWLFLTKNAFLTIFRQFFQIFLRMVLYLPLGNFWIHWTFKYLLDTLDLQVTFGYVGLFGTFCIPLTLSYLLNTFDLQVHF